LGPAGIGEEESAMTRKSAGLLLFREASGRLEVLLVHPGGPASSLADACNRWGLKVPLFSERLQARVRELLPATGSFRNPVDLTFFMDLGVMMEKLPQIILEDPEIDSLLMHGVVGSTFFRSVSGIARKWAKVPSYEQVRNFFLGAMEVFVKSRSSMGNRWSPRPLRTARMTR